MTAGIELPPLPLDTNNKKCTTHSDARTATAPTTRTAPISIPIPSFSHEEIFNFDTPSSSPPPPLPLGSPHSLGRHRLDAFHIICLIGKGGFGKVFLVRHKATQSIYAMKVMDKEALIQKRAVNDAHAERNILAMLGTYNTPFIIRLHIAFQTRRRVYLVMDFASGGELMFHLRREAMLSEDDARFYAAELLLALQALHDRHVVHRDIKPENVLLDGSGHLVLTDFGLAKEIINMENQSHSWCGSEDYMAPEIIARKLHAGKPADYWAYGIFIFDCLCGHPPFSPLHEQKGNNKNGRKRLHDRILKIKPKLPPYLSPQCHSLLRKLLTKDVEKRLTDPEEIKSHPWFENIDWDALQAKDVTPPFIPPCSSPTACFSPSLTKTAYSAPHSPLESQHNNTNHIVNHNHQLNLNLNNKGIINNGCSKGNNSDGENIWQGFSFVAPGMEVHFELAPPAINRHIPPHCNGPVILGASPVDVESVLAKAAAAMAIDGQRRQSTHEDELEQDDTLVAELAEFSAEAKEAVEIFEN